MQFGICGGRIPYSDSERIADADANGVGNTNTHGRCKPDVRTFLKRWVAAGPTHHFALGVGHHASALCKVAECLGIEAIVVAEG